MSWDRTHFTTPPRRRIAGQAVLLHPDDRSVLLLELAHRPCLNLPGGHSRSDEEPRATVQRLVRAQLGLALPFGGADLATVDYARAKPESGVCEGYNFVFARELTAAQAAMARPRAEAGPDLRAIHWVRVEHLPTVCADYHVRRITEAASWLADAASAVLLTNGALA
ncbi:NUDIX hydrolase [Kitasatospora sp. NBC_01302]|uniref:NUDIX hydrolase n=1 Tax=Kitasatospora sp. NBC_01302 TaxID=2903575 RepID=UPI002E14AED1|nr:NUDIX domain-containing protein [Kitasatospora sp. NBC_01302]